MQEEGVNITANSLHPGTIRTNLVRDHNFINCKVLKYFYSFIYDLCEWKIYCKNKREKYITELC